MSQSMHRNEKCFRVRGKCEAVMCFMFFIEEKNGTITFMSDHMEKTNFGLKSQG